MIYKNNQIQWFLRIWYNVYKGNIDGIIGEKTKEAIKKFQKDKGLAQDGVWGSHTEAAAMNWVRTVQTWLWKNRYLTYEYQIDGIAWTNYENAFHKWDKAHGYKQDAIMTSEKLKKFQQEDLPDVQDYEVWGMDESHVRAQWKHVDGLTAYVYKLDSKGNLPEKYTATSKGKYYTFDNVPAGTTIKVKVRFGATINGCKCWSRYTPMDWGKTSGGVLQKLRDRIHSETDPYAKYPGWCELWCSIVYRDVGLTYKGSCCANHHRDNEANKGTIVPNGALVYSGDNYKNVTCDVCGRHCGHVGIYLDGKVYSAQRPYGMDFYDWTDTFGYGGWSKDGNNF